MYYNLKIVIPKFLCFWIHTCQCISAMPLVQTVSLARANTWLLVLHTGVTAFHCHKHREKRSTCTSGMDTFLNPMLLPHAVKICLKWLPQYTCLPNACNILCTYKGHGNPSQLVSTAFWEHWCLEWSAMKTMLLEIYNTLPPLSIPSVPPVMHIYCV